jgi:type I restriction enzyme M protein
VFDQLRRQFWVQKSRVAANKYDLSASRYKEAEQDEQYFERPEVTLERLGQLETVMRAEMQELMGMMA